MREKSDFPETTDQTFVPWRTSSVFFFSKQEDSLVCCRYITMTIKHSFSVFKHLPKLSCNNVLQPSSLRCSGCVNIITLSLGKC